MPEEAGKVSVETMVPVAPVNVLLLLRTLGACSNSSLQLNWPVFASADTNRSLLLPRR